MEDLALSGTSKEIRQKPMNKDAESSRKPPASSHAKQRQSSGVVK